MYSHNFSGAEQHKYQIGNPYLTNITYIQASEQPDWSFFMHTHDELLELSYVLSGRGALYCNSKYYELKPGTVVVKNPGVQHAENSDPHDPIEQVCLLINGLKIGDEKENVIAEGIPCPVITAEYHRALLDSFTKDMLKSTAEESRPNLPYLNQLTASMLYAVHDEFQRVSTIIKTDDIKIMEQIRIYIERKFMNDISLASIAERFHFSEPYLSRQFKKYTGFSFSQYLVSCRIGEAQKRLIFLDERIDETAQRCGYSNLSYFFTAFHRKVGCTPAEYKRLYAKSK